MENQKKANGLLDVIPSFGSNKNSPRNLSSSNRRYVQSVEKALASFDSLEEWADYIAFLSKLQRALQINEGDIEAHSLSGVVLAFEVGTKLALCLSQNLPNGVHQKAIGIYEIVFQSLNKEAINRELNFWLPGLLPTLSYCSIQLKPKILEIYRSLIPFFSPCALTELTRPLILSLLPGLDDVNSEIFKPTFDLIDLIKRDLNNNAHFWQCFFLCVSNNPERRLGALNWFTRRFPSMAPIETTSHKLSEEAEGCIAPDGGILIRCFSSAINTSSTFNSSNDIIVIRGFFDLLLKELPLNGEVIQFRISDKDRAILLDSCAKVTLRKDMSLNKRLWNWLLGPDSEVELTVDFPTGSPRALYFKEYAVSSIKESIVSSLDSCNVKNICNSIKIAQYFILDKWEIAHLLTPAIFITILKSYYKVTENGAEGEDYLELTKNTEAFFNAVETPYIWRDLNDLILEDKAENFSFLSQVIETFDFSDEEMRATHVQNSLLLMLTLKNISIKWVELFEKLLDLLVSSPFVSFKSCVTELSLNEARDMIKEYYTAAVCDEPIELALDAASTSFLIFKSLEDLLINHLHSESFQRLCEVYCKAIFLLPDHDSEMKWNEGRLKKVLLDVKCYTEDDSLDTRQKLLLESFGVSSIFIVMSKSLTLLEKKRIFKVVFHNLWIAISSPYPANYQLEAVKMIFDLGICISREELIVGISRLILESSLVQRIRSFSVLWIHSISIPEADYILDKPLYLILDSMLDELDYDSSAIDNFLLNISKSGSANRLFKILTTPLLNFDAMKENENSIGPCDDIQMLVYYLKILLRVFKVSTKSFKDAFNNELISLSDNKSFELFKSNNWEVSTYKKLVICMVEKILLLNFIPDSIEDLNDEKAYFNSINYCLELYSTILTGNEIDFVNRIKFLIASCSNFSLHNSLSFDKELVEKKFLSVLAHFLKLSNTLKINTDVLYVGQEEKTLSLVNFIIEGITRTYSSSLLNSWMNVLKESLYLFKENIFREIFALNDVLMKKLEGYFSVVKLGIKPNDVTDIEDSISILFSGLEDLVSISHSCLLSSNLRFLKERQGSNSLDSGFFGSMIQGVFQLESPEARTTEESKLYSILSSIQDTAILAFDIWHWADSSLPNTHVSTESTRAFSYFTSKLRFSSRKLLEALIELERKEVVQSIVSRENINASVKLLHILDGGRPQTTLPHVLNYIVSCVTPSSLDESRKFYNEPLPSGRQLSKFLFVYINSIDSDSIVDIWSPFSNFLKEVTGNYLNFMDSVAEILAILRSILLKLNKISLADVKKFKKDFSESYLKLLTMTLTNLNNSSEEEYRPKDAEEKIVRKEFALSEVTLREDLFRTINIAIGDFTEMFQDVDKSTSCLNVIVSNISSNYVKSKNTPEMPYEVLMVFTRIGECNPVKAWRQMVADIFFDSSFFHMTEKDLILWQPIINNWSTLENDKVSEILSKMAPLSVSSSSNIFAWNDGQESKSGTLALKRLTYLILCQSSDFFVSILDEIFLHIGNSLNASGHVGYKTATLNLLRAISLKFSEQNLLPHWVVIHQSLSSVFCSIINTGSKDLSKMPREECNLALAACKLLDVLLLCDYDEFALNEWLYVSSNPDLINNSDSEKSVSYIDIIAQQTSTLSLIDSAIVVQRPSNVVQPLLTGIKNINSLSTIRTFFNSLSLISYERRYNNSTIDFKSCEVDLLNDIIL